MSTLPMYKPCEKCGGTEFGLGPDILNPEAEEGRIVCLNCGYNATATGWNHVNADKGKL